MALSSPGEKLSRSNTDSDDDSDDDGDDETLVKKNHSLVYYFLEFVKGHIKCRAVLASL